jgi:hypothetical protein
MDKSSSYNFKRRTCTNDMEVPGTNLTPLFIIVASQSL